jgi:subtilisin family serine protease
MQRAIELVQLTALTAHTRGRGVRIGLIDGSVDASRLTGARPVELALGVGGPPGDGVTTRHGTFIAGLLVGATGLCPEATLVSVPVFRDEQPVSSPEAVAEAVHALIDARVDVINLSLGIASGGTRPAPALMDACQRAQAFGVAMVAAAGNQARMGPVPLARHPWTIPVASCLPDGTMDRSTNAGPSTAARGLLAPGWRLDGSAFRGGTSQAAAFVTAALALLRARFGPTVSGTALRAALLLSVRRRPTIVPPLLNAAEACRMVGA